MEGKNTIMIIRMNEIRKKYRILKLNKHERTEKARKREKTNGKKTTKEKIKQIEKRSYKKKE